MLRQQAVCSDGTNSLWLEESLSYSSKMCLRHVVCVALVMWEEEAVC
jgi:hypothetical protein